jgi:hypothetical protein
LIKPQIFYVLSTCLLKISVSLFLLRVATQRVHILIIHAISMISAALGFSFFFVLVFQCYPISDWWSLDPTHKHCINPSVIIGLTYAVSGLNVIADWTLGILPIFVVRGLDMSKRQKRLVAGILSFAAVGSAATIVRLPYIGSLKESFDGSNGEFLRECPSLFDLCLSHPFQASKLTIERCYITDNTVGVAIWTTVEVGIGISAGCLATLRPLMRLALARFGLSSSSNTGGRPQEISLHSSRHQSQHSRRLQIERQGDGGKFILVDPVKGQTITTITGGEGADHYSPVELEEDSRGRVVSGEGEWRRGRMSSSRIDRTEIAGCEVRDVRVKEDDVSQSSLYEMDAQRGVYEMDATGARRDLSRDEERRASVWSIPSRQ